ncbi:MAG: VWA domain-containing protein [Deltaproteobacteria bacterium]|nr:VWA domain-containing protein [Deltaproteobacteria bacterium]
MSLLRPEALPFLLLAPLVWLSLWALDRARRRRFARVVGPRAPALAADLSRGRRRLQRVLFATALLLALLALLQPVWGDVTREVEQRGVDILVCLDVSQSMLARDLAPSRLERARREIAALAARATGDRLGLVVFAGEARLAVPLTRDRESFQELIGLADPLSVERGGTDLGAALATALEALKGQTGEHEVVLLLTDGEDLEGRGLRVSNRCRERNVTVHTIGFGSALGAKIPIAGEGGEAFLRDRSGTDVVSKLDASTLRRIAEATGGGFRDAHARPHALPELYEQRILPMARKSFERDERRAKENRFQWPLLAAFLLWILDPCLGDRRR